MKKFLIFGLSLLLGLGFVKTNAANPAAYNIITNPGADLAHEVNVNWHSDVTGTVLEYTLVSDDNYTNKVVVNGEYRDFNAPTDANIIGFYKRYIVTASLTDLQANTKYKYRVGKDGSYSKDYFFSTAQEGTFSFLHITDPQYGGQAHADIFNNLMGKAYTINPDIAFTFFTGDIIDRGGNEDQWKMFFNASNITRNIIAVTPGNHEYYDAHGPGAYFEDFFNAGYNNPKNGAEGTLNTNYYFRYNNALFISINSEARNMTNQRIWFEEVVKQNYDANIIIVGMHRSMYGSVYASDSIAVRANWQSLFDKYGVDLVLSGHDHIYSRSHHIYNNQISTDPIKGTTYIIGGAGGAKFYNAINNDKYAKVIEQTSCANIITVSDTEVSIKLINKNGNTIDSLENPIKTKRIGNIDENFSKTDFESAINIEAIKDFYNMGAIDWPKNAYGNVISVSVFSSNDILLKDAFMYHPDINNFEFTGLRVNEINQVKVIILYKDNSTSTLEYEIDATIPKPVVKLTIGETLELIKTEFDKKILGIFQNEN